MNIVGEVDTDIMASKVSCYGVQKMKLDDFKARVIEHFDIPQKPPNR